MITFIFNVVTLIFCVLAEQESKKMCSKFANVTPALKVLKLLVFILLSFFSLFQILWSNYFFQVEIKEYAIYLKHVSRIRKKRDAKIFRLRR